MRLILLFALFSISNLLFAQTEIYSEDFTGQNGKGAVGPTPTIDLTGVDWTIDISSASLSAATDWFQVENEIFEGRDLDGDAIWLSPSIDISAYTAVSFSLEASESGTHEPSDIFETEYRINGGSWTAAATNGNLNDDFTSATVSQTGLTGNSLEIRVTMNNGADSELLRLDDVLVEGLAVGPTVGFDLVSSTVDEGDGTHSVAVSMSNYGGSPVTISIAATDVTSEGTDYTLNTTSLTFSADGTQNISLTINEDVDFDDEELTLDISLSSGTATLSPDSHTLTITDNDIPPTVSFDAATSSGNEGDSGTTDKVVDITISSDPASDVTVTITTAGSATSPGDYTFSPGTLTFSNGGSLTQSVTITVNGDTDIELDETVELSLDVTTGPAVNGSTTTHTCTITNDDACSGSVADNFTDGDFTSSPVWQGDDNDFAVNTFSTVSNGSAATDGHYLASDNGVGDVVLLSESAATDEWEFSLASPSFEPSSFNTFGVILMCDELITGNIKSANWNGYYLQIGTNGTDDKIELWRHSGTANLKVGDFPSSPTLGSSALGAGADIRITRSAAGEFELFYELGSFNYPSDPTTSAGTLTNNTHSSSCYFGIYTNFANPSSNRRVYLDNVNDNTILPINLASFTAKAIGSTTQLNFTTASEQSNSHFLIQRSSDGRVFETIDRMEGKGNSDQKVNYSFTDTKPFAGINYYRLHQFDFDGANEFFGPIAVNFRGTLDNTLSIWPIPAKDHLQVNLPNGDNRDWLLEVYDLNGRQLLHRKLEEKTISTSLDVSQLPAGSYVFRWMNGQNYGQQRFVKQ